MYGASAAFGSSAATPLSRLPFATSARSDLVRLLAASRLRSLPLLEIDPPSRKGEQSLLIDPNYFKATSLADFIDALRDRRPDLEERDSERQCKAWSGSLGAAAFSIYCRH